MSDFLIQISIVDGDLGNFSANAPAGIKRLGVGSLEQLTRRQIAMIAAALADGGTLYIVSHGNGAEWGGAAAGGGIAVARAIELILGLIPDGVRVWLCICDSADNAQALATPVRQITAVGYRGTPGLTWHAGAPAGGEDIREEF